MTTEAPPTGPAVLVYSEQHLIAQGIVDLLPDGWQDGATIVERAALLGPAVSGGIGAAVVDAGAQDAERAVQLGREQGATVITLIASAEERQPAWLLRESDAVLVRDRVGPRTLRVALAAGRLGLRLVPPELMPTAEQVRPVATTDPLTESAQRALGLLAQGLRDAEIAKELNISESAVRKLIQRAVKRLGARTRCQAVAAATRSGELT